MSTMKSFMERTPFSNKTRTAIFIISVSLAYLNCNIPIAERIHHRELEFGKREASNAAVIADAAAYVGGVNQFEIVENDSTQREDPSYMTLCRAFLDELKNESTDGEGTMKLGMKKLLVVVEEEENLCVNKSTRTKELGGGLPLWTPKALISIFGSAFIAHALSVLMRRNGRDPREDQIVHGADYDAPAMMLYSHQCRDNSYIQGYLPDILMPNREGYTEGYTEHTIALASDVCVHCMGEYDSTGECLLFPSSAAFSDSFSVPNANVFDKHETPEMADALWMRWLQRLLPPLKQALKEASESYRENLRANSKSLWWNDVFIDRRPDNLPDEDGVVINLSENTMDGDGTFLIPFYLIAERIARSTTTTIQIFVTESCHYDSVCRLYGSFLKDCLLEMYPAATTTLSRANPLGAKGEFGDMSVVTAAQWFARMLLSSHLICLTEDLECMLAASIKQGGYATLFLREYSRLFLEKLTLPKSPYLYFSVVPLDDVPLLPTLQNTKTSSVMNEDGEEEPKKEIPSITHFSLQNPPNLWECRYLRGRVGHWVQDMEYAKTAQYATPISFYAGKADRQFTPTEDMPYRLPTTYKWVDKLHPQCQTQTVNLEGLCDVMQRLGMGRVLFLGDSLTYHAAQSMHKLLGATDDADKGNGREKGFTYDFQCPSNGHKIVLQLIRNDELNNIDEGPKNNKPNCDGAGYCWPWVEDYVSNPLPTVVVANTGGHIQSIDKFRAAFDSFVETIDSVSRPNDIVFFRTSVPGHRDCMSKSIEPYMNFREYQERETKKWNWDMYAKHNHYVDRSLINRYARNENKAAHIELLDVYPMTVLRPDGHASSADCEYNCGRLDDCLHYSLPGPVDWWNHLLYSNLIDIATEKEMGMKKAVVEPVEIQQGDMNDGVAEAQ